nr:hypothetical protein [uncultured Acetatifactor sp.]
MHQVPIGSILLRATLIVRDSTGPVPERPVSAAVAASPDSP